MLFDCSALTLKHFDKPKHVGTLDLSKASVVHIRMGDQNVGEILDLYLEINSTQNIVSAAFQALGNPFLIAGASWISEEIQQMKLTTAEQISYKNIMDVLQFPITKQATAVMLEQALKQAIFLWRKKHDNTL